MKGQTYFVLAIIFIIIVAIFSVSNMNPVDVDYIFGHGETPLIYVILFSVLLGSIITVLIGSVKYFKLQKENKHLKAQLEQKQSTPLNKSVEATPTIEKAKTTKTTKK